MASRFSPLLVCLYACGACSYLRQGLEQEQGRHRLTFTISINQSARVVKVIWFAS